MSDLQTFQIAVRQSFMNPTLHEQLAEDLCGLWDMAATDEGKAWVMRGWMMNYHKVGDPGQAWQVYRVTTMQCRRDNLYAYTEAGRSSLKNKIDNNPNIYCNFSHDPEGDLELWGIEQDDPIEP